MRLRAEAFDEFARNETLIAMLHTAFPGIGHVRRNPVGYAWVALNYTNRDPNLSSTARCAYSSHLRTDGRQRSG